MSSYYWLNGKDLFKKAHDKYHNGGNKDKAAKYCEKNKGLIKRRERDRYRLMSEIERNEKKRKSLK